MRNETCGWNPIGGQRQMGLKCDEQGLDLFRAIDGLRVYVRGRRLWRDYSEREL